jgi:hypothetical protein
MRRSSRLLSGGPSQQYLLAEKESIVQEFTSSEDVSKRVSDVLEMYSRSTMRMAAYISDR